mgnify:CR=1 FL=1
MGTWQRTRWLLVAWVVGLGLSASPAWAVNRFDNIDSQYPFETTVVNASTASVGNFGPGVVLYGFRLIADDAADVCGLYDVATLPLASTTQGVFIDELTQDTDNRTVDSDWPRPYVIQTDLTVITNAATPGACIIYHSPF